jgi:hypothetical protein
MYVFSSCVSSILLPFLVNVFGAEPGIFRVAVNGNKLEKILSLKGFRPAGTFGAWLSLTPNDDPLVLRDGRPAGDLCAFLGGAMTNWAQSEGH